MHSLFNYQAAFEISRTGSSGSSSSSSSSIVIINLVALTAKPTNRLRLKCDDTRAEPRFRLSCETDESIYIGRGASVQSNTGSRGVRISDSNAGYVMLRGSVKLTGYSLHSPVSPSLPLPCVTVCHQVSIELYNRRNRGSIPNMSNFSNLLRRNPNPQSNLFKAISYVLRRNYVVDGGS